MTHDIPSPGPPATGGSRFRRDFLASLVVFMVALPLCIAIAMACQLPPELGLITGIIGGLVVAPMAGSPLQVSGPAAGLIVLVLDFILARTEMTQSGSTPFSVLAAFGVVVFLAGVIQLTMAALRLGRWFRAVSPAVVLGMLGGIGVVIVAKQIHVMIDDVPGPSVTQNLITLPEAAWKGVSEPTHRPAALAGLVSLFVLLTWKPFAPKRISIFPAALVAVIAGTLVSETFQLPANRIQVQSNLLKEVTWLTPATLLGLIGDRAIWTMAVAVGVIASAETLLCATAVDQMHRGPRTNYNRELMAQGIGNTLCGILGALPMTGVIVRSAANVTAGAQSRWSATMHGLWLLIFVSFLPVLLQRIPVACLAAVLVYTGVKLVNWRAGCSLWRDSRSECLIFLATLLGVVFTDLLTGVLIGVALTAAKLIYTVSHLAARIERDEPRREVHMYLEGAATFLSLPKLAHFLEQVPTGWSVHVYVDDLDMIDHSCLHLLAEWEKQHQATGGNLTLDQDGLRARFDRARPRTTGENGRHALSGENGGVGIGHSRDDDLAGFAQKS